MTKVLKSPELGVVLGLISLVEVDTEVSFIVEVAKASNRPYPRVACRSWIFDKLGTYSLSLIRGNI